MIKLKKLINERKFGEPLPTLKSEIEKHQSKKVVTEDVETAIDMLMKRWRSVIAYWEDNKKIPKIIVRYKREWERIVDKMDREVRKEAGHSYQPGRRPR